MKTEKQIKKRYRNWLWMAGVLLAGGSALSSCSEYDLDERTPEGWGPSIYSPTGVRVSELQRGLNIVVSPDGKTKKVVVR